VTIVEGAGLFDPPDCAAAHAAIPRAAVAAASPNRLMES